MLHMATFLAACVKVKLNIMLSDGSSAGKTMLLNELSSFIPVSEWESPTTTQ